MSLEFEDSLHDYEKIRKELNAYKGLSDKPEIIALTKTDTVDATRLDEAAEAFAKDGIQTTAVSVLDDASIKAFGDLLARTL